MPRITTIEAGARATAYRAPNIRAADLSALGSLAESVSRFGSEIERIGGHLRAQQDEIDAADMIGQYEAASKEEALMVDSEVSDFRERPKEYATRLNKRIDTIMGESKSPRARAAFQRHVARNRPVNQVDYNASTITYGIRQQNAKLSELADEYSRAATLAATPDKRDELIQGYLDLLDQSEMNLLRNPEQVATAKKAFREKAQVDFMNHLRATDPERLFELEAEGAFSDVPIDKSTVIMDRATRERAARVAKGQAEYDKAMVIWRESIERETEKHLDNNTLTEEWLSEYEYALSSEKVRAYRKAMKEQVAGINHGDPVLERALHGQVYDVKANPRVTLDRIASLYVAGRPDRPTIARETYATWSTYLRSEIDRRDNLAKAEQDRGAQDRKELVARRYRTAVENIDRDLRSTSSFEEFNTIAAEEASQAHRELQRRSEYIGEGREDSLIVYRDLIPRYIARVENRMDARLSFLENQLGNARTRAALREKQSTMSAQEYEQKVEYLMEYIGIRAELVRLNKVSKLNQGKDATVPKGRTWE